MKYFFFFIFTSISIPAFSQEETTLKSNDSIKDKVIFAIATKPSKVAFFSAILPGLGQAHNKDYWKIPIIYGALGSGIYAYKFNNDSYIQYRTAYKLLQLGLENDLPFASEKTLERGQKFYKKYRDLSTFVTIGLYILQIVEASVDAHLQYHNTAPDLSLNSVIFENPITQEKTIGLGLSLTF